MNGKKKRSRTLSLHWIVTLVVSLLLALTGAPAPLGAEESDLPSAENVLRDFLSATGGEEARAKLTNRVAVVKLELPAQGISLRMTIHSAPPNLNYTVIESDVTGKIEKGTDGDVVWELSELMGAQVKQGQERADFLREASFDRFAAWRSLYREAECTGIETVDGRPAYAVRLTPAEGQPQTAWFDLDSKLLIKHALVVENPMGSIPMESFVGDYREVDGVKLPHRARVVLLGQQREITTESIEHNVDLPADRFALPPEIRALVADSAQRSAADS